MVQARDEDVIVNFARILTVTRANYGIVVAKREASNDPHLARTRWVQVPQQPQQKKEPSR